jgi:DNA-directed RNA polymerase specialized sigma subunit
MQREFATDPANFRFSEITRRPYSPYEALMVSIDDTVETSTLELLVLRELIADAMDDNLSDLEMWVFNALFVERKSLRRLSKELSIPKTTVARIRDRATKKLREALQSHPAIQEYLGR